MKKDMTEGREWSSILLFSLPIMGANLLQVLYNLADSVIVGNLISSTALGAVGLTSSMVWLLTAICTSFGAGVNIAVAQYFGAKKENEIQETISAAYVIAVVVSLILTAICFLVARPVIFGFLQAPEEMRFDSVSYYLIYSCGIIFQLFYNVTYGILRAHGDSRGALFFLIISAALNIVMDCTFISVFHWGVSGAAAASVIAQAGSAIASFLYMRHIFPDLMPKRRFLYAWKEQGLLLTRLSIPIMLQNGVNSLGFLVLQRLINSFGAASIEGYAAMLKVEQLAHIPSQSFNVAISSFAGQNIGANKLDRARRGYKSTITMGILISISISIIVLIFDRPLLQIFAISGESLRRAKEHLDILMCFIWVSTINNITCGFLQGAGDVKIPASTSSINLSIRLVLSFLLALTPVGFRCYYVSMPPAWLIACSVVVLRYRSGRWREYRIIKE